MVRSVTLLLSIDDNSSCEQILECPILKLVLILEVWSVTWYQDDESLTGGQLLQLLNLLITFLGLNN